VTDLDSTLQAPNEALLYGQWKVLQAFLALGGFLAIITGSSSENVVKRVGQWIEPSYRDRVLFFSENGAVCFRLGSLGPEYLYNLQPEFDAVRDEVEQAVRATAAALGLGDVAIGRAETATTGVVTLDHGSRPRLFACRAKLKRGKSWPTASETGWIWRFAKR